MKHGTDYGLLRWLTVALHLLPIIVGPNVALAWGADAHRLVAGVARQQLSPAALAEVNRLLALEPGSSLESIATWADEVRAPATSAWHFVNFPRGGECRYDALAQCPNGNCAVAAIQRQLQILGGQGPDEERLKALKYLVHLIADVHQPLHAGYADDRGGNQYQVQAFGRGTNLHSLWDSMLVTQWLGGAPELRASVEALVTKPRKVDPASWAEESCRVVAVEGFYPARHGLAPGYLQLWGPVLSKQLAAAASRLAAAVNLAIDKRR